MSRPSETALRQLSDVDRGTVVRTDGRWTVGGAAADASTTRRLAAALEAGWIAPARLTGDPALSVRVDLTDAGRAVLATYWPAWTAPGRA